MAKDRNPNKPVVKGPPHGSAEVPMSPERRALCKLLNLNNPSDGQLYADALSEIRRLEQAIEDKAQGIVHQTHRLPDDPD